MKLKVLLYSRVFSPSIGGIEIVSQTIADQLILLGHECVVITETVVSKDQKDNFSFKVERAPNFKQRFLLALWADVIHSNGASMALFWFAKCLGKPFVWTHGGYQLLCIDGLGWVEGEKAPLDPYSSFLFHKKRFGLKDASIGYAKLLLRRICLVGVDANVAITHWVSERQKLPNQLVIYNPFPLDSFSKARQNVPSEYDFIYVGRLVSEKGIFTLLAAFKELVSKYPHLILSVVGDGNRRAILEEYVVVNKLNGNVLFFGKKTGANLLSIIEKARIGVVPSEWEEPMGGVALELLAAGKNLIVSKQGGLAECVGDAGLTFQNGCVTELAEKMEQLFLDKELQLLQRQRAKEQLVLFDEQTLTKQYISLYGRLIA